MEHDLAVHSKKLEECCLVQGLTSYYYAQDFKAYKKFLHGNPRKGPLLRELWQLAGRLVEGPDPGDLNQAVMVNPVDTSGSWVGVPTVTALWPPDPEPLPLKLNA